MATLTRVRTAAEQEACRRTCEQQREHERREVARHFEEHPEIFSLVPGRHLAYSTGVFVTGDEDLDTVQDRKLARIRRKLAIRPGERVLDVGCGWGSILLDLARHTEGILHGITLSAWQQEYTLQQARDRGLAGRVRVERCHVDDLRPAPESYDVVIFSGSIVHMHQREAVHELVGRALRPGGRLLISDCYFPVEVRGDRGSRATHYIFVTALGYCRLLALAEELALIERTGLDILHVEDLTRSYVLTLDRWIDNVRHHWGRIAELAPGFAKVLQAYRTVARVPFDRRTALEYMILATKGRPRVDVAAWPIEEGVA
jgi:cyclopropane-fatty-acyl-phospholipid synthase